MKTNKQQQQRRIWREYNIHNSTTIILKIKENRTERKEPNTNCYWLRHLEISINYWVLLSVFLLFFFIVIGVECFLSLLFSLSVSVFLRTSSIASIRIFTQSLPFFEFFFFSCCTSLLPPSSFVDPSPFSIHTFVICIAVSPVCCFFSDLICLLRECVTQQHTNRVLNYEHIIHMRII